MFYTFNKYITHTKNGFKKSIMPRYRAGYALTALLNCDIINHIDQFEENPDAVFSKLCSSSQLNQLIHGLEGFTTDLDFLSLTLRKCGYTPTLELNVHIAMTGCEAWLESQFNCTSQERSHAVVLGIMRTLRLMQTQTWWAPCLTRLFKRHCSAHHATVGSLRYARLIVLNLPLLQN